ncbi:MAG: ATP-binding cassette domain-containing protein [Anaerolineae bacterium]
MSPPIIHVDALVKRDQKADRNAVDGISFDVAPGEFFSLLGPNGAGKTTTISILTTTLAPSSGTVTIDGHDLATDAAGVRRSAGITFQTPSLDKNLSAEENVRLHAILYGMYPWRPAYRLMPGAYKKRLADLADVVGLGGDIFKPVRTFSGGMRRKLEVVRSLIHHPRVLFLDEPTTGLDPASRRDLWDYLLDMRRTADTTLFLTTHYLAEAEDAGRICVMSRGRIIALGTPADVTASLLDRYVLLGAGDPAALRAELSAKGIAWTDDEPGGGRVRVAADEDGVQRLIKAIDTPLTTVRTVLPTLEDAYLALVERDELGAREEAARLAGGGDGAGDHADGQAGGPTPSHDGAEVAAATSAPDAETTDEVAR